MILYKLYVFCSDMKFKMAATAGLSLTLDPMGKMFQSASSLTPLVYLKPNYLGNLVLHLPMIIHVLFGFNGAFGFTEGVLCCIILSKSKVTLRRANAVVFKGRLFNTAAALGIILTYVN
jgi:hypothetical protein